MDIIIIQDSVSLDRVRELAQSTFGDMVKAVVDIDQKIMAIGGELHADAEALLLEQGSKQNNLWGINIYPDLPQDQRIEFTSLINIRPRDNNRSIEVQDQNIRTIIKNVIDKIIIMQ